MKFGRLLECIKPDWLRDGMIVECVALPDSAVESIRDAVDREEWGDNELVWFPRMHRGDKLQANIDWVAQSVIQSIIDNITQEELEHLCSAPTITNRDVPPETRARIPHTTRTTHTTHTTRKRPLL